MARSLPLKLLLAAALLLVAAPAAQGYSLFSSPKLRTYTYSSSAKEYKTEVKAAVRAWNRSGVRVRWAQSKRPRIRISVSRQIPTAGLAQFTYGGRRAFHGTIRIRPGLGKSPTSELHGRAQATAIIVHEMGHIMGLNHEDRRCAVMNSLLWQACKGEPAPWRYRCRMIERDDLRGMLKRFGGRARKLGPEFCDAEAEPGTPTGFTVTSGPDGVKVTFTTPPGRPLNGVRVLRRRDTCPVNVDDQQAEQVAYEQTQPGETRTVPDNGIYQPGRYCYIAVAIGKLGRPSKSATAWLDYAGSPLEEPAGPAEEEPTFSSAAEPPALKRGAIGDVVVLAR